MVNLTPVMMSGTTWKMAIRQKPHDWQLEREMAPDELRMFLDRNRLYQMELAAYLDIDERTVRRYLRGAASVPVPVVLLLRALDEMEVTPKLPRSAVLVLELELKKKALAMKLSEMKKRPR